MSDYVVRTYRDAVYGNSRIVTSTAVGSGIVPLYRSEFDKQGVLQIIEDGEHDLYAEIQSHAASTDMNLIIDRYFSGDASVLSRVQGTYADITGMPDNIHEALTLMENARKDFEVLPPDIKELFNNDYNQFIASFGTEDWLSKMQINNDITDSNDNQSENNDSKAGD